MSLSGFGNSRLDSLSSLYKFHTNVDVLRLDLLHPVISGNKWFKLTEYIKDARRLEKSNIVTWGGLFSNHLLATAAFAQEAGLHSTGIVRGERPVVLSQTLVDATSYGMDVFFVSRTEYKTKSIPPAFLNKSVDAANYFINEGGYGTLGAKGAEQILASAPRADYTHIVAAVGTGTTLAGIISASSEYQQVVGVSVFKNNFSLVHQIEKLIPVNKANSFSVLHDYHFGGYAKYTPALIQFMNDWYLTTNIPSDFVYTAKLFYATNALINAGFFPAQSKLLVIHSGGLQGNRSLPHGTLIF